MNDCRQYALPSPFSLQDQGLFLNNGLLQKTSHVHRAFSVRPKFSMYSRFHSHYQTLNKSLFCWDLLNKTLHIYLKVHSILSRHQEADDCCFFENPNESGDC